MKSYYCSSTTYSGCSWKRACLQVRYKGNRACSIWRPYLSSDFELSRVAVFPTFKKMCKPYEEFKDRFECFDYLDKLFSAHFNFLLSVSFHSQFNSIIPCCKSQEYIQNIKRFNLLQKLSRYKKGILIHFENKVYFKATHKFTQVNNIYYVSLVSSEEGCEYYQKVSDAWEFFQIDFL